MERKEIEKLEDLYLDTSRSVINQIQNGRPKDILDGEIQMMVRRYINEFLSLLQEHKLNLRSASEYIDSSVPILLSQVTGLLKTHDEDVLSLIVSSAKKELTNNIQVLTDPKATDDDKKQEVNNNAKQRQSSIEDQKDEDLKRDRTLCESKFPEILEDFSNSAFRKIASIASANGYSDKVIDDRIYEVKAMNRRLTDRTSERFGEIIFTHTSDIYSLIDTNLERIEQEVLNIAGLNKDKSKPHQEQASEEVDIFALTPEQLQEYLTKLDSSRHSPKPKQPHSEEPKQNPFEDFEIF